MLLTCLLFTYLQFMEDFIFILDDHLVQSKTNDELSKSLQKSKEDLASPNTTPNMPN